MIGGFLRLDGVVRQVAWFIEFARGLPGIEWIVALIVLLFGISASSLVVRALGRPVARRFRRPSVTRTVLRSVRLVVIVIALVAALWIVGLRFRDLLLSAAVLSVILGIVLAPIIGSIIHGVFVLADQPFEVGDLIELTEVDQRGYIEDVTLRYTKIFTLDNTFIVVPNSTIREQNVINYSAEDERTRLSLRLLVTYESDIHQARDLLEQAARETDGVITGGPDIRIGSARYTSRPTCRMFEYADDGVLLVLRFWVRTPYHINRVNSLVNERAWDLLETADVTVAYPHSHLVFDDTSGELQIGLPETAIGPGAASG